MVTDGWQMPQIAVATRRKPLQPRSSSSSLSKACGRLPLGACQAGAIAASFFLMLFPGCGSKQSSPPSISSQTVPAHARTKFQPGGANQHEGKMLADALKKRPAHIPVLLRLASLALESGKLGEAERYLKEVQRLEPGNVPARLDLGKVQFESGHVPEAIQTTAAILKEQPDNPDALYNLGAIYGNLGQREQAIEYWNRLLASNPQSESGRRAQQMMPELQRTSP